MPDQLPQRPLTANGIASVRPVDPMPEVAAPVAILDLVEDDHARSHIARNYPPCEWRDQVVAFMFLGFIAGARQTRRSRSGYLLGTSSERST